MLVDRYDPVDLFAYVPRLYRDFEPELKLLDGLLDDDVLFARVRADLAQRYPNTPRRGRPSTPVEVILRMLVVKRLYGWSYEETEHFVSDSLALPSSAGSTSRVCPTIPHSFAGRTPSNRARSRS